MRLGIIDIGYNAIRAVAYENNTIGSPEIFNYKFKNDVLSVLAHEDLDIKHQFYLSIDYILHIFKNLQIDLIKCVATAILRDHPRKEDFTKFIQKKYNFTIEAISGQEEAYLTAAGLISGISEPAHGIVADLGGGSLELIEVHKNNIGRLSSLDLGTRVISKKNLQSLEDIVSIIKDEYGNVQYKNLYLIGGSLRFICRSFIELKRYPLKNLHNLTISYKDFSNYLKYAKDAHAFHKKDIDNNAILVAQAMLEIFQPNNITVSTFGLKEGVRYEFLPKSEKNQDIVLQKALYFCDYNLERTDFDKYYEIISPLLYANKRKDYDKIMKLAIIFQSKTKCFDSTLPPKAINEYVLNSEIPFTHRQRMMITIALSYYSNFKIDINLIKMAKKLLSDKDFRNSQIIGHFIRVAQEIDGFYFTKPSFTISNKNRYLEIVSKEILPRSIFDTVCHRLKSIAFIQKISA